MGVKEDLDGIARALAVVNNPRTTQDVSPPGAEYRNPQPSNIYANVMPQKTVMQQLMDAWKGVQFGTMMPEVGTVASVADGMTRLYRGETAGASDAQIPEWLKSDPQYQATVDATGRWFSNSPEAADYYVKNFGKPGNPVTYVDIPTEHVNNYLSANQPDIARHSAAGMADQEYFLPKDLAATRKPLR